MTANQGARYKDLMDRISAFVKESGLKPGDRLPSEREFTRTLGVSQPTVNKAVACLIAEGRLRREGYRLFVAGGQGRPDEARRIHVLCPNVDFQRNALVRRNLVEAACEVCGPLRWDALPLFSRSPEEQSLQLRRLLSEGTEGFVIWPLPGLQMKELLPRFERQGVPFVVCDLEEEPYDFVGIDNEAGSRLAVEHLASLGHREIAYLTDSQPASSLAHRLLGYQQACMKAGLAESSKRVFKVASICQEEAGAFLERILSSAPETTAVFCGNDTLALHLMNAARALRVSVPKRLSVAGFDDVDASALSYPALTTVSQDFHLLGVLAVEALVRRMRLPGFSGPGRRIRIRLEPSLAVRRSTASPG